MTNITAADIRSRKPALVPFEVPGWGGTVYIRKVPLSLRLELFQEFSGETGVVSGDSIIRLVIACVMDEEGGPLFVAEDTGWLDSDFPDEVQEVFSEILRIAGWSAGALEESEGN